MTLFAKWHDIDGIYYSKYILFSSKNFWHCKWNKIMDRTQTYDIFFFYLVLFLDVAIIVAIAIGVYTKITNDDIWDYFGIAVAKPL